MEQQAKNAKNTGFEDDSNNFEFHEKMSKTKRHRTRFSNDQLAFLETQFNSVTHYSEFYSFIHFFNFIFKLRVY